MTPFRAIEAKGIVWEAGNLIASLNIENPIFSGAIANAIED
jgi:hypothetical protein